MGSAWIIINRDNSIEEKYYLYSNLWTNNIPRSVEVIIILDLVKTITIHIENLIEVVVIHIDNKFVAKMINKLNLTLSNAVQDVASIIISIRDELQNSLLYCRIEYIKGYPKRNKIFENNLEAFLIK